MHEKVIAAIDRQLTSLQQARAILFGADTFMQKQVRRPKGSKNTKVRVTNSISKRTMSPEGRARIAEAQRKRWAASKRAAKKTVREQALITA